MMIKDKIFMICLLETFEETKAESIVFQASPEIFEEVSHPRLCCCEAHFTPNYGGKIQQRIPWGEKM